MCLAEGHKAVMLVRLEPVDLSLVKHSTTELSDKYSKTCLSGSVVECLTQDRGAAGLIKAHWCHCVVSLSKKH